MKNEDREIIVRIIRYCDDVRSLLGEYGNDFKQYKERNCLGYID